jgi:predicted nuclease with TOPRIM domain
MSITQIVGKVEDKIQGGDAINSINNDQSQYSTAANNSAAHFSSLVDNKINTLEESFQLKMRLMEQKHQVEINDLQKELACLKQEKHQQKEEFKGLRARLEKLEAGIKNNSSNNIHNGSSTGKKDSENHINYNNKGSNIEEKQDNNSLGNILEIRIYNDPVKNDANLDSSGNMDPKNVFYS